MHLEDLVDYISESYPNIWALTGLHFNDDVNYQLASYFKSRYTIYYQHGSNGFGGVCLAIAREVSRRIVSEFNDVNNLIAADVFNLNKKYTVTVVYSPPSEEVPVDIFNRLHRYNRNLILVGDLNARHPSWHDLTSNSYGCRLAEWIDEKQNLRVFNTSQPTSTTSRAIVDLIVAPHHVSTESTVVDENMRVTDHYPVHWQISSFSQNRTTQEVKRIDSSVLQCILNLKQNVFFSVAQQMRQEPIEFILTYEHFLVALQERCTSYHIVQFYRPSLPVYLVNLIKHRRRVLSSYRCSRSEDDRNLLRSMNSYIHQEFKAVKRAQWQEFCLGLEPKNTHRFWNYCKNLFKNRTPTIQGFQDAETDRVLTDPNSMIEDAHRYYSQVFKERETSSQNQDATEFKRTLSERLGELPSQPFLFKIADLHRSIHRLKTKTSSGHEKVPNKLLKSIPLSHYGFLLQIFNDLLVENTYPEHWKLSKMILLPKEKSSIISLHQTRSISLLPCLGKVYERYFLVYIIHWMTMNDILPPEQSGFREKHSTTTTRFVQFLQHISSGLLQQTATLVIYIDFIKAFDQLWHDGLIYKLHKMNCPHELVIFIIEYLRNRKSYIEINRLVSSIFDVERGVSQGSCLEPILFLLVHCELPRRIPSAIYNHLYADDLALIIHASPWWCRSEFASQMECLAKKALKQVQSYAIEWKQPINFEKTVWQWIHRRVYSPSLDLVVDEHRIKRTSVFKYLGNYIDERLSFSQHCNKMLQKIQKMLACLNVSLVRRHHR